MKPGRHFEDLRVGETTRSRDRTISQDEILKFARDYDPQWFHADAEAAKDSFFGELIASGIHSAAIWRQLDHETNGDIANVCGVAWDNVRWKTALRAGDTVHARSEILSLRPSGKRPDRGVAVVRYWLINQHGQDVLTFDSVNLIYRRAAA